MGLQLEHTLGITALKEFVNALIVKLQCLEVDIPSVVSLDQCLGMLEHREGAQAKKIHLEKANFFKVAHHPLRCDGMAILFFRGVVIFPDNPLKGNMIRQRAIRYHDARGMRSGVPVGPFQPQGDLDRC